MILIITFLCVFSINIYGQNDAGKIYNPAANASADIGDAVKKAKTEGKNVLIQVGGNWCTWCLKVHKFIADDSELKKLIDENYVFLLVNYSKENKNEEVLKNLGNPSRFGFPVFVVLNSQGSVIHIQDSGYLEEDKTYSKEKLSRFLKLWTADAVSGKKR